MILLPCGLKISSPWWDSVFCLQAREEWREAWTCRWRKPLLGAKCLCALFYHLASLVAIPGLVRGYNCLLLKLHGVPILQFSICHPSEKVLHTTLLERWNGWRWLYMHTYMHTLCKIVLKGHGTLKKKGLRKTGMREYACFLKLLEKTSFLSIYKALLNLSRNAPNCVHISSIYKAGNISIILFNKTI